MKLLLDTHALLWFTSSSTKLSAKAKNLIDDPTNLQVVSIVSLWEITIKHSLGRLTLPLPLPDLVAFPITTPQFRLLPIQAAHLLTLDALPHHHNDPFDRLLIAQAIAENLPIISTDPALDAYGVTRLW
jgi:PIN domain nuclease of toxin-antitoxin system